VGALAVALSLSVAACVAPVPARDDAAESAKASVEATGGVERVARRATVRVRNRACGELRTGSGVVVGDDLIVTNRHVVEGAEVVQVNTWDGRSIDVTVNSVASDSDLGLLRVDADLPPAVEEADRDPATGDPVVVAGYPGGERLEILEANVLGQAEDVLEEQERVIVVDAPVRPGNSGGPVLDEDGRLVAVVFAAALEDAQALAIPLSRYRELRDSANFSDAPACTDAAPADESAVELGTLSLPAAPTTTVPVPCPASPPVVEIGAADIAPAATGSNAWQVDVSGTISNPSEVEARAVDVSVDFLAPAEPSTLTTMLDEAIPAGESIAWSVSGEVTSPTEPEADGVRLRWVWTDVGLTLRCI
jgi:V8-like Glu-specific endopeptidase